MTDLGILVTAYARPDLLRLVLESLKRQNALGSVNVWIDGTAGRRELTAKTKRCEKVAREFEVAEIRCHNGHLGIEKMMIDALTDMMQRYQRIIVLEDDCFPTSSAISEFVKALEAIEPDETLFSTYGHHFRVPGESLRFSRFQGWGWATTREKLRPVHAEVSRLFNLDEKSYLDEVQRRITPEVTTRLEKTPGRFVLRTMARFFSWDSCTALVTAERRLDHMPTPKQVVYNCGLDASQGHFAPDEKLRKPPFNMITPDEVWSVYDQ